MEHVAKEEEQVRKAKLLESHKRQGPWLASRVCVESHSRSIFKPHPVCSRAILPGICASLATPTSRSRESFRSPGRVQGCLSRHRCSVNKGVTPLPEPSRTGALGRWENMLLHHPWILWGTIRRELSNSAAFLWPEECYFLNEWWRDITNDKWIAEMVVQGYSLPFGLAPFFLSLMETILRHGDQCMAPTTEGQSLDKGTINCCVGGSTSTNFWWLRRLYICVCVWRV